MSAGYLLGDISEYIKKHVTSCVQFPFVKSSVGSTGITLLPLSSQFPWVLKWQNFSLTESEYVSTKFYEKTFEHLSVPETVVLKKPVEDIAKLFRDKTDVNGTTITFGDCALMCIKFKRGSTLKKMISKNYISLFSDQDLKKIFFTFGQIAAYDYLIANFDRFLPSNFDGENINNNHSVNDGNVLIEFNENDFDSRVLEKIHVIDNAPLPEGFFLPQEKKETDNQANLGDDEEVASIFEFGEMGLFADSEDPQEPCCSENIQKKSCSSSELSPVNGEKNRQVQHEKFQNFMSFSDKQLSLLAEQIYIGIRNLRRNSSKKRPPFLEKLDDPSNPISGLVKTFLFEGLKEGQARIRSINADQMINTLQTIAIETVAGNIVRNFIVNNLTYIKQTNLIGKEKK